MELQERLTADMKTALKAGQKDRLSVIRMLLSDVKNRDLMPGNPSSEEIIASYRKKLQKSADEFAKLNKADEVEKLKAEMAVVDEYLPKKASAADTEKLVDGFLVGKTFSEKQLGQAMGAFMKQHGQNVDAAVANQLLRSRLAGK